MQQSTPLQQLVDLFDRMLVAFAVTCVPKDLHLEISVQMAQAVFSSFLSSIFLPCHFVPAF